jgi:4-hydroxy-4-methyl-2-oxoglutarate aldolase
MRDRFLRVYTAALADILDDRGLRSQTLPPDLRPLVPGTRLAGPAFTVEGRPSEHDDWDAAIRKTLAMLGSVPSGHVAVYQCNQQIAAHFGELSATSLATREVAGCVIDGGCRDTAFIVGERFPVFARHVTPEDSTWRWEVTATDVPIVVGRVRIEPGDWVVGDDDGVVIVPQGVAADVLAEAEAKIGTENAIRDAVRAGMTPLEAYERHGTF